MIDKYEVDPDGFEAEVQYHLDELKSRALTYEQLLRVAACAMTEAEYNEGVYYADTEELIKALEAEKRDPEKVTRAQAIALALVH